MTTAFDTSRSYLRHRWQDLGQRAILAHVGSYFAYLVTAWIGLQLAPPNGVSPIWPASGIALAMVLHFGPQMAIPIFAANLSLPLLGIDIVRPFWVVCAFAIGAAAEPLISAIILRRWFGFDPRLLRLRDLALLALIGGPVGPLFSSMLAVLTLHESGALPWHDFLATQETFWFGNTGGIIMLAGPMLVWLRRDLALPAARRLRQLLEALAILVIASILPLGLPAPIIHALGSDPDALAFLSFPLIAWASIRLEMKISMAITLLISIEAIATAHWSSGLFQRADPSHVLFNIQLFVLSLNATNQLLSGLARQERQAAEQLKERESFLSLAVRGSNDGLFDYDRGKGRLWLSPRWKQQLGYRDADLESSPASWRRLILKEDLHKAVSTLQSLNRGIAAQSDCILRFRHRNGHVVHVLCRAAVHRNARGRLARLVGTHTDISDLVTARQELEHQTASLTRLARDLNRQRRLAEAANDAKSAFLATVSHEVRTPLNGVVGMLNLLIDNNLTEDQRRQASVALNSAEDMLAIINDILDVTKLEAGRISLETGDCDMHAIIEGVVALFSGRAASKGVSLSAEIAGNVPRFIRGDQSRLRQVLMNLVGNAVKFTLDGDILIKVTTAPMTRLANAAGDIAPSLRFYLMVDVVDTGIGIPAEKIGRLFERFQQADSSITRRFGGSGLGLTICKQLVELMGGQISVDSKPGFGSTFHVVLPCSIGQSPEQRVAHSATLATLDPCRVLVVEDNAVNSALVTEMLSRYGHQVTVADNGSTALMILDRQQFDVILMDVQMPEMDGVTTTQWIRALDDQRAHIPIIALTADTMDGSRERYLTAGFSDYLEKPVRANQLLEAIARHVPSRHAGNRNDGTGGAFVVPPDKAAEIDRTHLAMLHRQMAPGDIDRMISNMEVEFEFELRRLKIAVGLGDRDACRLALQALSNDALEIGAIGLATFTRDLASVSEDVDVIFAAIAQLQLATSRAVAQLRGHVSALTVSLPN
ncbi:MAG TPA: ATP-binding protein [Dongiaceae bacterium]|nr:ATP-binding protein [Dongiaceae bacterium]